MYRALAVHAQKLGVDMGDQVHLESLAREGQFLFQKQDNQSRWAYRLFINGQDVTEEIRTPEIDMASSRISAYQGVHAAMVEKQRAMAQVSGVVMEGRDIGTVVLPDADIKFYLTASVQERARRRHLQMQSWGRTVDRRQLEKQLRRRDRSDSLREVAPLSQAADAIVIDTTNLPIEEVLEEILTKLRGTLGLEI
jgi:cytidylate kinase